MLSHNLKAFQVEDFVITYANLEIVTENYIIIICQKIAIVPKQITI